MNARIETPCSAVFVCALALLITACASEADRQQLRSERTMQRTLVALKSAGDADSLAAAAELGDASTEYDTRRLELLTGAVALAPDRVDLLWLQLAACSQIRACDPTPIAATLRRLDPENGAAWTPFLNQAVSRGDAKATVKYLAALAKCKRFDVYWNSSIAHLTTAVIKVHTVDARVALTAVIGAEAALALPAYEAVAKACGAPALQESGRLGTCRGIAVTMRGGDTYISEMLGIAMAKRVWPATSAEYADATAERRLEEYRIRTADGIALTMLYSNASATEYLQLLRDHRTEQEMALAIIAAAGKNPNPPAHWTESYPP